jgi:antitoxin component YwqK of YwqJK toxin-antitoxin module
MNTSKRLSIIFLLFWSFSQLPAQNIIRDIKSYHDSGAPLEIMEYEETEKLVELSRTVQLYLSGKKKKESNYSGGTLNGKTYSWFTNGQMSIMMNYTQGKRDGNWISWYKNGIKRIEGYHKDGRKTGTWTMWSKDGKKIIEELYEEGKLIKENKY